MQLLSEPSRRLRRGRRAHDRRPRRRGVDPQRIEGLDHRRLVVRLGPVPGPHQLGRSQAPWAQRLHLPPPPRGSGGATHRPAQRVQGLLPGVPHRSPRPRHATASARSTRAGRWAPAGCSTSACCTTPPTSPCPPGPVASGGSAPARSSRTPARPATPTIRGCATWSARPACSSSAGESLQHRLKEGMSTGAMSDQSAAVGRLFGCMSGSRIISLAYELCRCRWRGVDRRRRAPRRGRHRLPDAPDRRDRGRHHRDGPQRGRRARPRHAPGTHLRQGRRLPRRPARPQRGSTPCGVRDPVVQCQAPSDIHVSSATWGSVTP